MPKLQPISDMGIQDSSLEKLLARETQLQERLEGLPFHQDQDRDDQLQMWGIRVSSAYAALLGFCIMCTQEPALMVLGRAPPTQVHCSAKPCREGEASSQGGKRRPAHGYERRGTRRHLSLRCKGPRFTGRKLVYMRAAITSPLERVLKEVRVWCRHKGKLPYVVEHSVGDFFHQLL